MFSKIKVTSAPNAYFTHFPLAEVYEAEICRLRNENQFLVTQMNEALAQLHREQAENAQIRPLKNRSLSYRGKQETNS